MSINFDNHSFQMLRSDLAKALRSPNVDSETIGTLQARVRSFEPVIQSLRNIWINAPGDTARESQVQDIIWDYDGMQRSVLALNPNGSSSSNLIQAQDEAFQESLRMDRWKDLQRQLDETIVSRHPFRCSEESKLDHFESFNLLIDFIREQDGPIPQEAIARADSCIQTQCEVESFYERLGALPDDFQPVDALLSKEETILLLDALYRVLGRPIQLTQLRFPPHEWPGTIEQKHAAIRSLQRPCPMTAQEMQSLLNRALCVENATRPAFHERLTQLQLLITLESEDFETLLTTIESTDPELSGSLFGHLYQIDQREKPPHFNPTNPEYGRWAFCTHGITPAAKIQKCIQTRIDELVREAAKYYLEAEDFEALRTLFSKHPSVANCAYEKLYQICKEAYSKGSLSINPDDGRFQYRFGELGFFDPTLPTEYKYLASSS
ncbi:MAG: hypothetical protein JSS61_01670 [Verrucomicrobia bacterium]|nr:hypothetical protein [Verrucomicrobiota bacterium]